MFCDRPQRLEHQPVRFFGEGREATGNRRLTVGVRFFGEGRKGDGDREQKANCSSFFYTEG